MMKNGFTNGCNVKVDVPDDQKGRHYDVFEEVVLIVEHLRTHGVLTKISEGVHFARLRFGHYEIIDFLAVLFGYAISGERTLEAFYARLHPFAGPFMALFERDRLPSRSALSRFLAALTKEPVEALRTLFLDDLLSCPLSNEKQTGGLTDRAGDAWIVFDLDGTREAARQRALPKAEDLPPVSRRLDVVCAPGYTGRIQPSLSRRFLVPNEPIIVFRGHSDWLAMRAPKRVSRLQSDSSAFPNTLRPHLVGP